MGFFKRKKDEEVKIQLEREALDKFGSYDNQIFDIPEVSIGENIVNSEWKISGKIRAPHTITAEELNAKAQKSNTNASAECTTEEIPMTKSEKESNSPSDFLYNKMMQSRVQVQENITSFADNKEATEEITEEIKDEIPAEKIYEPLDIKAAIDDIKSAANLNQKIKEQNFDLENINEAEHEFSQTEKICQTEQISEKTADTVNNDTNAIKGNAEERRTTLLARCNAYLEDNTNTVKFDTEKYKLESVESILESFEARAAERINKKFNSANSSPSVLQSTENKSETSVENIKTTDSARTIEETAIFKAPASNIKSQASDTKPIPSAAQVKHIFSADGISGSAKDSKNDFDDISSTRIITDISSHSKPTDNYSSSKTAVFPVIETAIDTQKTDINDLKENDIVDDGLQTTGFEDYKSIADRPKILGDLIRKKKAFTIKLILSFLVFIPSLIFAIPNFEGIIASKTTLNIIEVIICLFALCINFNTLVSLKSLFNSKAKNALPAALTLIAATLFSVINLIFKGEFVGFSSVAIISLISYNLSNRNFYLKTIKNFNFIANTEFKNAVSIINNKSATKTIVDNSIEGSALVCYGGETTNIHNFLRYSFCKNPISDKIQKLSLASIIIAFCLALTTLLLNSSALLSVYIFCTAICFAAVPSVYHIVSLTINSANKRLNHYDAMITGYHAADELELCNAIAVSSEDLFPEGTVRLVDMKLLSPNPFDQSILDAAAISSAIHSPLAGIFKQMDTSKAYNGSTQEIDTVIYEEKMGISGWVNDRRVFVGNRDLLIAHGFVGLPPAELDKKIMRKGYFPVYIASDNIPCALLVVKYEPDQDIVYEMQRLANTGTTIIVDNCDPNINSQMLTDYFELYSETICVMNKQGSDFYKALIPHKEHRRAGAVYKSRIEGLLASLTASINIKKYISRMSVFYISSVILGLLGIITCILTSLCSFITPFNILIVQLLLTAITLLPTILRKP